MEKLAQLFYHRQQFQETGLPSHIFKINIKVIPVGPPFMFLYVHSHNSVSLRH